VNRVRRRLTEIVDDNKKSLSASDSKSGASTSNGTPAGAQSRLSFLSKLLIQSQDEKSHLDIDRLIGNLLTFFANGTESTMITLSICLYILVGDRGLQEKIASESFAYSKLDEEGNADSQHLYDQCPRARSLVYEVLRFHGPAPLVNIETVQPIDLDGTELPAKTQIVALNGYAMTSDFEKNTDQSTPRGWKDSPPSTFDAERYLILGSPSEKDSQVPCSLHPTSPSTGFRAFGSSIFACPGQTFVETKILLILGCILCKFEIGLKEGGHVPLNMVFRFTRRPDSDIHLTLKPRSWD
jgi:cytochrome P450